MTTPWQTLKDNTNRSCCVSVPITAGLFLFLLPCGQPSPLQSSWGLTRDHSCSSLGGVSGFLFCCLSLQNHTLLDMLWRIQSVASSCSTHTTHILYEQYVCFTWLCGSLVSCACTPTSHKSFTPVTCCTIITSCYLPLCTFIQVSLSRAHANYLPSYRPVWLHVVLGYFLFWSDAAHTSAENLPTRNLTDSLLKCCRLTNILLL